MISFDGRPYDPEREHERRLEEDLRDAARWYRDDDGRLRYGRPARWSGPVSLIEVPLDELLRAVGSPDGG